VIETTQRCEGRVLHILLNQPKGNILDRKMIASISSALDTQVCAETCLIVFAGAGKHFCFGASVQEHRADEAKDMLREFHDLFRQLAALAVPTCAVVRGQCLGGGLELASWCSWIVATPDARLGQPEIQLAVFPPMASLLLPWRVGGATALELCISGRSLGAQDALKAGLINAITDDPEAWWTTLVEERLGRTSAASLRVAERAVRRSLIRLLDEALPELESLYLEELMAIPDASEGIDAFLERRAPIFNHTPAARFPGS
jgi:cyclohexa-1,5-dienecarbonyl-CoA hydratase